MRAPPTRCRPPVWCGAPLVFLASLASCVRAVRPEPVVRAIRFNGVDALSESDLRERLASRETSYFPGQRGVLRWWRWWWREPEYFDETAVARDRLRITSYYNARGYFDAEVTRVDVTRPTPSTREVTFEVREAQPTRIADVRIRGCARDGGAVADALCDELASRFASRRGDVTTAEAIDADRAMLVEAFKVRGFPSPRVSHTAAVDPEQHLAWIEYAVTPGPTGRIGEVRLHMLPSTDTVTGPTLPNGMPTSVIRSALWINPGEPYSLSALAAAQQNLLNLGAFNIARIDEHPRPDGTVDLDVQLATSRLWRLRLGGGFEVDNVRNNLHLAAGYERRNFLGGLRRLRVELRPQLSFPSLFSARSEDTGVVVPGVALSVDLRQPELFHNTTGVVSASFEYGPDPFNPSVSRRQTSRVNVGVEHRFSRRVTGSAWVRFAQVAYAPNDSEAAEALSDLTLAGERYLDQAWLYLEQSLVWDDRDDPAHTRRGTYAALTFAESARGPWSDYGFFRASVEGRGYVTLSRAFTLAVRGAFGMAIGVSDNAAGWPVPQDLRFYSGGALSNRGFPSNRVGVLGVSYGQDGEERIVAVGGAARWEASAEIRWMPGAFGLVAFFDASQVAGIDVSPYLNPQGVNRGCATTPTNRVLDEACDTPSRRAPSPQDPGGLFATLASAVNPAVGIGARWLSPFGIVRFDVGFRLVEGGCGATQAQIDRQNRAVASGTAESYVTTAPSCSTFPLLGAVPSAVHIALGEAF